MLTLYNHQRNAKICLSVRKSWGGGALRWLQLLKMCQTDFRMCSSARCGVTVCMCVTHDFIVMLPILCIIKQHKGKMCHDSLLHLFICQYLFTGTVRLHQTTFPLNSRRPCGDSRNKSHLCRDAPVSSVPQTNTRGRLHLVGGSPRRLVALPV